MKKFLLIPILLIAGAVSASAHCGTCGTGEAHGKAAAKACPADCAKPCCDKAAKCDKSKAECAKAKCDKPSAECAKKKAECEKKAAAASANADKKACCPMSK